MASRIARPRLSLKARALRWLAQREYSRQELRRKLLEAARRDLDATDATDATDAAHAPAAASGRQAHERLTGLETRTSGRSSASSAASDPASTIDALLDELELAGHLSEQRFVESRISARATRFGDRRIEAEIRQHGLDVEKASIESLAGSERHRAYRVWSRRFGPATSDDRHEQARQARFLAARGFSAETIRDVVLGRWTGLADEGG